jgi:hypothetical protein
VADVAEHLPTRCEALSSIKDMEAEDYEIWADTSQIIHNITNASWRFCRVKSLKETVATHKK